MKFREILTEGRKSLSAAAVPDADLDAWYLLEYVTGLSKNDYFLYPDKEIDKEHQKAYEEALEKRKTRVPLQQIVGSQEFMGLAFKVSDKVLCPRQDTEILTEQVLRFLKPGMTFLDLCTGSGCIGISLLKYCPGASGAGADLSAEALRVAEENAQLQNIKLKLIYSDLFSEIPERYDLIVSNPPYIPTGDIAELMEEVRDHEPMMALDGKEDGLYFYKKIIEESPKHLTKGGRIFFEIGYDQAAAVTKFLEKDFTDITVVKDLSGLDRVVYAVMREDAYV